MAQRPADDVIRGFETKSDKIRALGREGYGPADISRFLKIRYQFAYGVLQRAGLVGARNESGSEPEAPIESLVDEAIEQTFTLEKDLQEALRRNIGQLEAGLTIIDDGNEKRVASGLIDITAADQQERTVAIELKAGIADRNAVAQLQSYMGDLMLEAKPVRGILVAQDFSERAIAAARVVPNIALKKYAFQFSFQAVK